jgi:alpha-beta hydrolase superfamily lysophospholipase
MVSSSKKKSPYTKANFLRLQDQVTDLERDAATPSAILNPSVSVILVAHSMG